MLKRKHKLIFQILIKRQQKIYMEEAAGHYLLPDAVIPNATLMHSHKTPNLWAYRRILKGPTNRLPLALADSG